jgi:pyruvate ferredoxin oxidoreductase gamma subunit
VYRIRFHGRGGQGIKTAGRILGSAFFAEGFEVQDAPRYGAERRGAPLTAVVRAARRAIHERGPLRAPDLVVVADESLVPVATAGVLDGVGPRTTLLVVSAEPAAVWSERLRLTGPVLVLPPAAEPDAVPRTGSACAGAAARVVGVISRGALEAAAREEVAELDPRDVEASVSAACSAFELLTPHAGSVGEGEAPAADALPPPEWIELAAEPAAHAAPDVFAAANSVQVRTGLWRSMRPVIDRDLCRCCTWVCTTFCPDGALHVDAAGRPEIDYEHCKGCLVCVAVCPPHAIRGVPERNGAEARGEVR